jgi:integrase
VFPRLCVDAQDSAFGSETIVELGYTDGFRIAELLSMKVRQVDLLAGTIRLNPGETKNGKGREAHMTPAVRELFIQCVHGKQPGDALFTRHENNPIRDFRGAGHSICVASGLGQFDCPRSRQPVGEDRTCHPCARDWKGSELKYSGLIFHDLKRRAVREMVREGVPEPVAMSFSRHKTRSVFDRYDIVTLGRYDCRPFIGVWAESRQKRPKT